MAIAIFNPKWIDREGRKEKNTANVKGFVWSHARWALQVGELKKFPEDVAEALLRTYGFLVKVEKTNLAEIEEMRKEKEYQCEKCDFGTNTRIAFVNHAKTHKDGGEDSDGLENIESAKAVGDYKGGQPQRPTPEELEGIPSGGTKYNVKNDRDGVGWYGAGVQEDTI